MGTWSWWKEFRINILLIPSTAKGGNVLDRGAYIAGEKGPELITNTPGATVVSASKTLKNYLGVPLYQYTYYLHNLYPCQLAKGGKCTR